MLFEVDRELNALMKKVSPQVVKVLQSFRINGLKDYAISQKDSPEKDGDASGGVFFDHSHDDKLGKMKLPGTWLNSVVLKNVDNIVYRMKKGGFFEGVISHELSHGYMMNFLEDGHNNKYAQAAYKNAIGSPELK